MNSRSLTRKRKPAHVGRRTKRHAKKPKQLATLASTKKTRSCSSVHSGELTAFVKASARLLGLPIEPEWEAAVTANLAIILRLASAFADSPLPDEAESAPVFTA
jgi:hypothetical protein